MVPGLFQDLKHSARMLLKNPGFTSVAIVSIAIGVGANAAMFSMADALVLRPLPVPRPGDVMTVAAVPPAQGLRNPSMSYRDYVDVREGARSFERLAAYQLVAVAFATAQDELAQRKVGVAASENLLETTGRHSTTGTLVPRGREPGRRAESCRRSGATTRGREQFGADLDVIDRQRAAVGHRLHGDRSRARRIHRPRSVHPPRLLRAAGDGSGAQPERTDGRTRPPRLPLAPREGTIEARRHAWRRRARTSRRLPLALEKQYPASNRGLGLTVQTELQSRTSQSADTLLVTVLMTLSFAVLLVACANVAGLLASRTPERARELALRLAMGARRSRVMRQLLTESLLLSIGGGLAGPRARLLRHPALPPDRNSHRPAGGDSRSSSIVACSIVGFTVAIASALLSSLLPAWRATRGDLAATLKDASGSKPRRSRLWTRHGLVCGQVALSLVLVTVSLWLYRGTRLMVANGPGYRIDHLLMVNLDPSLARYDDAQAREFFRVLKERTARFPAWSRSA